MKVIPLSYLLILPLFVTNENFTAFPLSLFFILEGDHPCYQELFFYFFTQLCTPIERKRYQLSNFWASLNTTQISWFLKTSLSIKNLLQLFVNHFWLKKWTTVTSSLMFEVWAKYQTKHVAHDVILRGNFLS